MSDQVFRSILASGIVAGFLAVSPTARAFDPAPVCAYPTTAGPTWIAPEPRPTPAPMCSLATHDRVADATLDHADARAALGRARALAADGRYGQAVLELRVVAEAVPALSDRLALEEADLRMADGPSRLACDAYERAAESPHRTVALRARLGLARCLLTIADREGVALFDELRRRYPELPQEQELDLLLGEATESWGDREEAGRIYRRIDLMHPGSPLAARARERIAALVADGVEVRDLTITQQGDRAERLVRSGPMELARAEVERLRAMELPRPVAAQVAGAAARIARVEGRWDDAHRLLRESQGQPPEDPEDRAALVERMRDLERAAETRELEDVQRRLRGVTRGRPLSRQPTARLFTVLRIAARAQLEDEVNDVLDQLLTRDRIPPGLRFDAAILAAGTGDDERVARLFASARSHPTHGVASRYHYARTLERLGRTDEARAELLQVIREDSRTLPYYAMWARQRLRVMQAPAQAVREPVAGAPVPTPVAATLCVSGPFSPAVADSSAKTGRNARADDAACTLPAPGLAAAEGSSEDGEVPTPTAPDALSEAEEMARALELAGEPSPDFEMSPEEMIAVLAPIAEAHGEAFVWLPRAVELIRLGELDAASDEIHETFTAWRDATGRGSLRSGLEGVLRGAAPPRHRVAIPTWRARRTFPADARRDLARVSAALGDHGMAIRLGGFGVSGNHPRAYRELVEASAARHGIEPELLHAVMRVESVYNPRIISYAGAIGLMQIMPRTGRLIADAVGREDFTVDQLLEPEVNIELAAWYLASLIERFDGRLPLAIASYNGGPHNVRRWMRDASETMPLDAFLERIEFDQTHRYVRRVLTHYEAYRAQRGQGVGPLDVELPDLEADRVAF